MSFIELVECKVDRHTGKIKMRHLIEINTEVVGRVEPHWHNELKDKVCLVSFKGDSLLEQDAIVVVGTHHTVSTLLGANNGG